MSTVQPTRISLLPEHLIDQIKAGEVIERPGNLIKEILENAIDAKATRLELTIKNNGLDYIGLVDNGQGIYSADLPLAFSRHATSKIKNFEDLYRLRSFGFRGEALASIAAISRLQCITQSQAEDFGSELRIEGGVTTFSGKRQKKETSGTELVIQDLFYNTPARLKFIQSQQAEKNFIKKVVYAFILAHPQVEFALKYEDDEKEIFVARPNLTERLADLLPKATAAIIHTKRAYENNEVELHLIPGHFRGPVRMEYVFINQRFVLDKQLSRVIGNALLASFGSDDFHFVLSVTLPPDNMDVNVHPNKTIIKLFEPSKLLGLVTGAIKELAKGKAPASVAATPVAQNFDFSTPARSELSMEKQAYNFEGHFSPHQLPKAEPEALIWVGPYFLKPSPEGWLAVNAAKLLAAYVKKRLEYPAPTVPLLVSEPFRPSTKNLEKLAHAGLELERLGPETLVLRGIPEWMNGFPLRSVVEILLHGTSLAELAIDPNDWSQSTWNDMLQIFSRDDLQSSGIAAPLESLLREKLR